MLVPAWQPPEHRVLPELIEQGRQALEHMLKPCGVEGVGKALMPLLLTQEMPKTEGLTDGMNEEEAQITLRGFYASHQAEYARHLKHLPLDILRKACDAHVTTGSKFFPSVFELASKANPEHERRKVELERLYALQKNANAPKIERKPFEKPPEHERLLVSLKHYETPGSMLYSVAKAKAARKRLQQLVDAELERANDQCRVPAAWTIGNEDIGLAPSIETPSDWRDAGLDDLLGPKVPRGAKTNTAPKVTDVVEEPPMPDAVPE